MTRKRSLALFALLCCSCGGGGRGDGQQSVQFSSFVIEQIAMTADDTDPVPIDGTVFVFSEDEHEFDELFP